MVSVHTMQAWLKPIKDQHDIHFSPSLIETGLNTENKTSIFSYHHSSVCKYQMSLSLNCIMLEYLIKTCWVADLSLTLKKSLQGIWHRIRTEFPIISRCLTLPSAILYWVGKARVLSSNHYKTKIATNLKAHQRCSVLKFKYPANF